MFCTVVCDDRETEWRFTHDAYPHAELNDATAQAVEGSWTHHLMTNSSVLPAMSCWNWKRSETAHPALVFFKEYGVFHFMRTVIFIHVNATVLFYQPTFYMSWFHLKPILLLLLLLLVLHWVSLEVSRSNGADLYRLPLQVGIMRCFFLL